MASPKWLPPQKLSDAAGAIVWDGVFGPFGEARTITETLAQNLRFPGQYADGAATEVERS